MSNIKINVRCDICNVDKIITYCVYIETIWNISYIVVVISVLLLKIKWHGRYGDERELWQS
jgi:hypothetical protein